MSSTRVIISTLAEDFKKIGLIKESTEAPAAQTEEPEEDLDEVRKVKLTGGGTRSAATRQGHKEYLLKMRTPEGRKAAKKKAKYAKKASVKRQAKKMHAKRVKKGLADGVQPQDGLQQLEGNETLKSFANAAIIADKLASTFTSWIKADIYEEEDERMFAGVVGQLAEIAESFASIAEALSEGKLQESADDVQAAFAEGLEVVLDAVDLFEANDEDENEDDAEGND